MSTRRSLRNSFWMAMVCMLALTGCSLLPAEEEGLKPPLVKPPQQEYSTVETVRGDISKEIRGNGAVESYSSEAVFFEAAGGRIEEVLVKAGDTVKKGDVLVQLDVGNMDIELKQMEINLLRSRTALRTAKLSGDEDALRIAQLQYDIEQIKYDRLEEAFLSRRLVAGIDGQVTFVADVKEGDVVESYQTLVMISDPTKLRIAFQVESSPDLFNVGIGFKALLKMGDKEFEGKVTQTPSSAPETVDERLRERYSRFIFVESDQLPEEAELGTRIDVRLLLEERKDVLIIPRSGLRSYLGRTFVRVLEDGDKVREVDVEPGLTGTTQVEIVNGLNEGDLVVMP